MRTGSTLLVLAVALAATPVTAERAAGNLVCEVTSIEGKLELFINGKQVTAPAKNIVLGRDNKLVVRALVVGARRQQSRDLRVKRRGVKLDGAATDYAYAYTVRKTRSSWTVKDERYEWKTESTSGEVANVTGSSRPSVVDDTITFVLGERANEILALDVSGRVQWGMSGTRADGSVSSDSSDETATGAIVIHVAPRK